MGLVLVVDMVGCGNDFGQESRFCRAAASGGSAQLSSFSYGQRGRRKKTEKNKKINWNAKKKTKNEKNRKAPTERKNKKVENDIVR